MTGGHGLKQYYNNTKLSTYPIAEFVSPLK
jgi:hypothetical protein